MKGWKILAIAFLLVALILGAVFYMRLQPSYNLEQYFKKEYLNQFGPLAICIELLVAGIHLYRKHPKANITLAIFGFTALLDPVLNAFGIFDTNVPLYGSIIFVICALISLWIAFTNTFDSGKISFFWAAGSFLLGLMIELFFN